MTTHFTLHAGMLNPVTRRGSADWLMEPGMSFVILKADHNGACRAVSSHGETYADPASHLGERGLQVKQGRNSDKTITVKVVGYVAGDGTQYGEVPAKGIQFFVYK